MSSMLPPCPLCASTKSQAYHDDRTRSYFLCPVCQLVFVHSDQHLSGEEELERYSHHQNDLLDPRYRNFLDQMFKPMQRRIAPHSQGLDFGSGPGPLLSQMFEEAGHQMVLYDSFYALHPEALEAAYDFITATEVVEHLYTPMAELQGLWSILKPGGFLGIMTSLRHKDTNFAKWYYINDDTHVVFYAPETMGWLADLWGAELEFVDSNVVIFHKLQ